MIANSGLTWQHRIYHPYDSEINNDELDKLGKDGWEMCGALTKTKISKFSGEPTFENIYYFKKPILT